MSESEELRELKCKCGCRLFTITINSEGVMTFTCNDCMIDYSKNFLKLLTQHE